MLKTDQCGSQYYDSLPENTKPVSTIWAFVTLDPNEWSFYTVNIGMKYLLQSSTEDRYYLCKISKYSKDFELLKYAKRGQLFIFKDNNIE